MANAASTIEIELEIRDAINRLGRLEGELKKSSSAMDRVANSTNKMESAFKSARNAASALFAAISVQQIAQAADTFTRFANQIRIATNSAAEAAAVQKELYQVSQATGTAIEDTTKLYARLRVAADQLGSSQAETIRITEIVAKSLAAAGTSSTEASGALLQLAQALNSPKVQAEEFNSLIDGMPNLLKEVEKQLGLTAGSLKKFVTDGNLTNQLFKDAILGSADAINEQFGAAQDTIATSFTRLNNAFILLVGNFEKSTGFFNSIASVISTLAENMDELARVLKAVAVGFTIAFAPKVIRAIRDTAAAMTVLGAATKTNVIGALAALGFYIADVTGGLDSLMEKLGLTKDKTDETAGAIVDLTKGGGGARASQSETYESAFFKRTINSLEGYLTDIEKYGPELTREIDKILVDVNRLLDEDAEILGIRFVDSDEVLSVQQYVTELSKIVEIVQAAIKGQRDYNELKIKDAQITEEGAALEQKILDAKFAINKAQEELNRLQKIDIYDGILNSLQRFLGIQQDITDETEKQLSNAEKQAKAREQYVNAVGDTIVSGTFGAGPNASRAGQVGQAYGAAGGGIPGLVNAAFEAALSNEKVAAAIDEQFAILFDTIDPLIDVLADLQSAINRLVKALIEGISSGIEDALDSVGLGPNGHLFGGGFARDIQGLAGFQQTPNFNPSSEIAAQASQTLFQETIDPNQTPAELQGKVDELIQSAEQTNLGLVLSSYDEKLNTAIAELESSKSDVKVAVNLGYGNSVEEYMLTFEQFLEAEEAMNKAGYGFAPQAFERIYNQFMSEFEKTDAKIEEIEDKAAQVIQGLISSVVEQSLTQLGGLTQSAQDQIDAIEFQNKSAEEQIQFRYDEAIATIEQQKALADLIDDEELRTQLLDSANRATQAQNDLLAKQQEELQKLNEERERELNLQNQNNLQNSLIDVFKDFEKGLSDISEIIDGLNTQINDLLFSDFNLAPASDSLEMATETYADLFAAALDPEATEEDVKAFQGFVDTYLRGARDVFKSSTAYRQIFDQVLVDLQQLGLAYGQSAPVNLIENIKDELESLETEFGTSLTTLIQELDRLGIAFANQAVKYSGTISVDLGSIDATFDSSEFTKAVNALNQNIADGITALVATIEIAKTSLSNYETSGTTPTITPVEAPVSGPEDFTAPTQNLAYYAAIDPLPPTFLTTGAIDENIGLITQDFGDFAAITYKSATASGLEQSASLLYQAYPQFADSEILLYTYIYGQNHLKAYNDSELTRALADAKIYERYAPNLTQRVGFRRGGVVDPLDTIPAMLSPGEYILSPETVRRYGVSNLNRLNAGDSAAINATSDPEVKRLLAELIVAVRENDMEVNVYTDMQGQTKASIEEFRSELRERTRRQGDKFLPARYI